jgi:hypothetical protein
VQKFIGRVRDAVKSSAASSGVAVSLLNYHRVVEDGSPGHRSAGLLWLHAPVEGTFDAAAENNHS